MARDCEAGQHEFRSTGALPRETIAGQELADKVSLLLEATNQGEGMKPLKIHPKIDRLKNWQVVVINTVLWLVALTLIWVATHLEAVK